jgi:hypothetical protein
MVFSEGLGAFVSHMVFFGVIRLIGKDVALDFFPERELVVLR